MTKTEITFCIAWATGATWLLDLSAGMALLQVVSTMLAIEGGEWIGRKLAKSVGVETA